jgi:hypothetical protein
VKAAPYLSGRNVALIQRTHVAVGLIANLTAGCVEAPASNRVVRTDSAGIEVVETRGLAWSAAAPWRLSPEPELSLGQAEGDEDYLFDQITQAVRLSDGRIGVSDETFRFAIRFFSADGDFLKSTVTRGHGPEELGSVGRLQRLQGDSLVLVDRTQNRAIVLGDGGNWARSLQFSHAMVGYGQVIGRTKSGTWLAVRDAWSSSTETITPGIHRNAGAVFLLALEENGVDSIIGLPGTDVAFADLGGRSVRGVVPYGRTLSVATSADRIYVGTADYPGVAVYDEAGRLREILRNAEASLTLADEDMDRFSSGYLSGSEDEQMRQALAIYLQNVPLPKEKAPYARVLVDADQNVWLGPIETPTGSLGNWHVFRASGEYVGEVTVLSSLRILEVGTSYVLGRWRDELGIETVRVYGLLK